MTVIIKIVGGVRGVGGGGLSYLSAFIEEEIRTETVSTLETYLVKLSQNLKVPGPRSPCYVVELSQTFSKSKTHG